MQCGICEAEEWETLPGLGVDGELAVCRGCGNVAFLVPEQDDGELREYYRSQYRPRPTPRHLCQGAVKRGALAWIVDDWLAGRQGLTTLDVGVGIGFVPAWLRSLGHDAHGTELTLTFRRFAYHWYGVHLAEVPDETKSYDLITLWHVLEHLPRPDRKLAHLAGLLREEGRMVVSTPEWFGSLELAGKNKLRSFGELYNKNHCNCFSRHSLKRLFAKCGLVVEREDHYLMGQSYRLRKGTAQECGAVERESWEERVRQIRVQKEAVEAYLAGDQRRAVRLWPRFPDAWCALICKATPDEAEQRRLMAEAMTHLEDSAYFRMLRMGHWFRKLRRFDEMAAEGKWLQRRDPLVGGHLGLYSEGLIGGGELEAGLREAQELVRLCPSNWERMLPRIANLALRLP